MTATTATPILNSATYSDAWRRAEVFDFWHVDDRLAEGISVRSGLLLGSRQLDDAGQVACQRQQRVPEEQHPKVPFVVGIAAIALPNTVGLAPGLSGRKACVKHVWIPETATLGRADDREPEVSL